MNNVFVVLGSTGEYSDRSEWIVGVTFDADVAKALMLECQQVADVKMYIDYTGTQYRVEVASIIGPRQ